MRRNFAVAVMVITPEGLVLVMDPSKPDPLWKFPGGHSAGSESPYETAARELEEETGISLSPFEFQLLRGESRGNHDFFFFSVILPKLPQMREFGSDGEKIGIFPLTILGDSSFFPSHRRVVIDFVELESPVS